MANFAFNDSTRRLLKFDKIKLEHHPEIEKGIVLHVASASIYTGLGGNRARFEVGVGSYLETFAENMPGGANRTRGLTQLHTDLDAVIRQTGFNVQNWRQAKNLIPLHRPQSRPQTHKANYALWALFVEMLGKGYTPVKLRA